MATETRELTCINCPLGCPLTVTLEDGEASLRHGQHLPAGTPTAARR